MSVGAAIFLLGALSAVEPPENYGKALATMYPDWALRNNRSVYALLDVAVRPDGTMMGCRLADWHGSHDFAKQACSVVWRIILTPARGPDGAPAYGRMKLSIKFMTGGTNEEQAVIEMEQKPDYTVTAGNLPHGTEEPLDLFLTALVQPDGSIANCEGSDDYDYTGLVRAIEHACGELRSKKRFILKSEDGKPVPYVDSLKVRLER